MFISFFSLLCLLFLSKTDALFGYYLMRCQFSDPDGHDLVYLEQIYLNKVFMGQYNSTLGKYEGYTNKTKELADDLNKSKAFLDQEKKNLAKCKELIQFASEELLKPNYFVEPYVRLKSVEAVGSEHPGMLLCSVYDFYPKQIKVTWLRNGKEVTSDVTSTEELSNGNWLYQIHSYLEYTPTPGEKITCMVEHASLMEPRRHDWDPSSASERNKITVGTAGLLLGLGFPAVGLIYYMKHTRGRVLVPSS